MYIILFLILSIFFTTCKTVQEIKNKEVDDSKRFTYQSKVPAKVESNSIDGTIYYKIYKLKNKNNQNLDRSVRTCYLQHGYGIDQSLIDFKRITFDNFVHAYYSFQSINRLLESACGEVIVAMQETNKTSILEMTQRTEKFIRDVVCKDDEKKSKIHYEKTCAFIGHSKGGAVAFNLARRCMDQSSWMGEQSCNRLSEIYSATGVIQGSMATFTVYGAYLSNVDKNDKDDPFVKLLGFGINLVMPIYEKYEVGKTNPTYIDLSPSAPMEDGMPLYLINDIALQKKGWLKADFAASAVDFTFSGNTEESLLGCSDASFDMNQSSCKAFGKHLGLVHSNRLQTSFDRGLSEFKKNTHFQFKGNSKYLDEMNWTRYQTGDGLADLYLSINSCQKGLSVNKNPSVKSCTILPPMNHLATAGGNQLALDDIIYQLKN